MQSKYSPAKRKPLDERAAAMRVRNHSKYKRSHKQRSHAILSEILPTPVTIIEWDSDTIKAHINPVVYIFATAERFTYIGSSKYGLYRIFDRRHTAVKKSIQAGASLYVVPCDSLSAARNLEIDLIQKH